VLLAFFDTFWSELLLQPALGQEHQEATNCKKGNHKSLPASYRLLLMSKKNTNLLQVPLSSGLIQKIWEQLLIQIFYILVNSFHTCLTFPNVMHATHAIFLQSNLFGTLLRYTWECYLLKLLNFFRVATTLWHTTAVKEYDNGLMQTYFPVILKGLYNF